MLPTTRELDWGVTPIEAVRRWPADRPVSLLHSGRLDSRWARWSVLAEPTAAVRCELDDRDRPTCRRLGIDAGVEPVGVGVDPWAVVDGVCGDDAAAWLGYFAYDFGRCVEALPRRAREDRGWPAMQWQRCPGWAVHDAVTGTWRAGGVWAEQPPELLDAAAAPPASFHAGPLRPDPADQRYADAVSRVIDYIAAGDVFQVNLAQRLSASFAGSGRGFFAALAASSPAWYGALIELLPFDAAEPIRTLASTSPELFLEADPAGRVTTRPIKGTRPAHAPGGELERSEKDAAELAMIVDLLRNDLGRVARFGTVRVDQPRAIEHHPTVQHATATITAELRGRATLADLLRATLPGGSITGAPKVRAMEIIDELEPVRRGPYCGSIGVIHGRSARLNIAIRTAAIQQPRRASDSVGTLDAWVGAGIVADSDPVAEHEETWVKARALADALAGQAACGARAAGSRPPG